MRRPIAAWRWAVQLVSFVILVYGGFIFGQGALAKLLPRLKAPPGGVSSATLPRNAIAWAPTDEPAFDFYTPGAVCRFNPGGGLFKACIIHMISENLTWQTSFKYLTMYLFVFVLLAFLLGRLWCGWACPLGTLGDALNALRRALHIDRVTFSERFRKALRWSAYALIGATVAVSAFIGMPQYARFQCYLFLPYCQLCPARLLCPLVGGRSSTWADFTNGITSFFTLGSWATLGLFSGAFFIGRRIWCHLCPIGVVNSWFNRGAATELRKEPVKCNRCGACADACPMGLDHVAREKEEKVVSHPNCVLCLRCVDCCPRDDCLSVTFFGKKLARSRYKSATRPSPTLQHDGATVRR